MRRGHVVVALLLAACAGTPIGPAAKIEVVFRGTQELPFRLRRVIEDLLIDFERRPESEVPLFDAALDLQDHFVDLGHPEARVTYELARGKRPRITFVVDEGPEVTIDRLQFDGHRAVARDELTALWSRTSSGNLGLGDPLFVAADLDALRLSVLELYDSRGFLDVTVTGPIVERAPGGTRARVVFRIEEGERYRFGELAIASELPLTAAQLGAANLAGRDFDRTTTAALTIRARNELLHTGYPDPRLELEVTPDRERHTVALRLSGQAGVRTTVGDVHIAGNEFTVDRVIARHVHIAPDTLYDGRAAEQTTSDLYRTGLFRRVEIERKPRADDPATADMTVRVEESDAHEFDLLLGYGSYETARGGVFWTDRNLFGQGQRLQVGVRASIRGESLTSSWTEPYVLGSDTSMTIGGHLRERQEPSFFDTSRGFDLAFARDLAGPLRGRLGYSLQSRDGRDIDPTLVDPTNSRYEIAELFAELTIDRRDSPLYPNRGHRLALKLERAGQGFGGNVDFDRLTWSSSYFVSLAENVVLGGSARTGVIWPQSDADIPLQERFFDGGESSVRSFRESALGPRSPSGTPAGGNWFQTWNLELRFPIVKTLHGAVFADAGTVGTDADVYRLADLRWAIGGGLRFVLPIGPVRLDAAANPGPRDGEDRWVLHFSVGLPF